MATNNIQGKKINELEQIDSLTLETVLPVVKIENSVINNTAEKVSVLQFKNFIFNNLPNNILLNKHPDNSSLCIIGDSTDLVGSICIGNNSSASGQQNLSLGQGAKVTGTLSTAIGNVSMAEGEGSVSLGNQAYTENDNSISIGNAVICRGKQSIAIGSSTFIASVDSNNCIAIGYSANISSGNNIYQIGPGYSYEDNTLNVAFNSDNNYTLLTGDGKIPKERLPEGSAGGVPILTWYKNNTGNTITLTDSVKSASLVKVYKNGVLLEPTEDYSISETTLTLTTALEEKDKITMEIF